MELLHLCFSTCGAMAWAPCASGVPSQEDEEPHVSVGNVKDRSDVGAFPLTQPPEISGIWEAVVRRIVGRF